MRNIKALGLRVELLNRAWDVIVKLDLDPEITPEFQKDCVDDELCAQCCTGNTTKCLRLLPCWGGERLLCLAP